MRQRTGALHIDDAGRQYKTADGQQHASRCLLLRQSYRDENGKPRNQTVANISALPDRVIDVMRKSLKGITLVDADAAFTVKRSVPHGNAAAAALVARQLGFPGLLGPPCRERDIAYGLILARAIRPASKLSTVRWWNAGDTTLTDLGLARVSADEAYQAMDWLGKQQARIENKLARRHLKEGGLAMYDLSSSWVEGSKCDLAAFGYSRDHKRGLMQIEYGLMTDPDGRPVGIDVFKGNTADSTAFTTAVTKAREQFGLKELVFVGDRGMITRARIADLRDLDGAGWVTALRNPDVAALAADNGPLQLSLFDQQNLVEIAHPDYPGERLVACKNPDLEKARQHKRETLLAATEAALEKISAQIARHRLKDPEKIAARVGRVIDKYKMAKHITYDIAEGSLTYARNQENIAAEARLDGIYVIHTTMQQPAASSAGVVRLYKGLKHVERDFRIIKIDDLDIRPVRHYLTGRVKAHMLIGMLAAYLTWHLRKQLAPLTFTDPDIPVPADPVAPVQRSPEGRKKDAAQLTPDGLPLYCYRDLLDHLSTLTRQVVDFGGQEIDKLTTPTPVQARAFELLGAPVPLRIT